VRVGDRRQAEPAVADDLRRHALGDLGRVVLGQQGRVVRVRVHVDEAGAHHGTAELAHLGRVLAQAPRRLHGGDDAVLDQHVGRGGPTARAVDDQPAAQQRPPAHRDAARAS
jgi:hypothetical protein